MKTFPCRTAGQLENVTATAPCRTATTIAGLKSATRAPTAHERRQHMNGDSTHGHHRLIVELGNGEADARTLRAVAEMAALFHWDLHGLFVENEALLDLAELPFVRELRLPGYEWQKIEADRIATELRGEAADAQRLLRDVGAATGVPCAFEVRRGDPADEIAAIALATDVLVVATPTSAVAQLAHGTRRTQATARQPAASLLLLPQPSPRRAGPVAALVTNSDDPALAVAALAAANTHEHLLLLLPAGDMALAEAAVQRAVLLGVPKTRVTTCTLGALGPEDVLHAMVYAQERMLVLTRNASSSGELVAASRIASEDAVAVLLLAPSS